ncbi:ATP-binding cassette domain-containing protein, partial [Corynebacterium sp.]|uniref:amino acid ABC transporter ATP-binding protein n=1 Tax=Corynebacterium sp. TaxID=1720 RepID=UPI0028A93E87
MNKPMVEAIDVYKSFGQLEVLKGINLTVEPGEVMCLIGPSGSGKSTFLRCVNHLEKITAGRLYVDGDFVGYREKDGTLYEISEKDASLQRQNIGMVFQSFNLFSHRTALENIIEAPIHIKGIKPEDAKTKAMQLLDQVGLAHKANAYPG